MAIVTSIAGSSGMGKTRSLKNMNWDNTFIVRTNKKPLPFKNKLKHWDPKEKTGNYYYSNDYGIIAKIISKLPEYGFKSIIIDDSTHLMTDEFMNKIDTKGLMLAPLRK